MNNDNKNTELDNMKNVDLKRNPQFCQTDVISRFPNYSVSDYMVNDYQLKFMVGTWEVSIKEAENEDGYLVWLCKYRDGLSFIETSIPEIFNRIEYVLQNGL
jgi:hypothetical protein